MDTIKWKNKELHEFRKSFIHNKKTTIIENKDSKFTPDQYCYDNALLHNSDKDIAEWLENKYKMFPTLLTLALAPNIGIRLNLIDKYGDKIKSTINNEKFYNK